MPGLFQIVEYLYAFLMSELDAFLSTSKRV